MMDLTDYPLITIDTSSDGCACYHDDVKTEKTPERIIRGGLTHKHLAPFTSRKWKSVLSWIAFHPDEVSRLVDANGQTALHHACLFKAPAYVVQNLLYAAPESAAVANNDGELPMHWAVRVSAPGEITKLLLDAYPYSGLYPDHTGQTALSLIWDRHQDQLKKVPKGRLLEERVWQRIMMFVRAKYYGSTDTELADGRKFRPLHCTVGCNCPLSFARFVLDSFPEQASVQDEEGRFPLAVAAATRESIDEAGATLLKEIIQRFPRAILEADLDGRLPLAIAIASGRTWSDGVGILFEAEPQTLLVRDPVTKLYPFMLAAMLSHDPNGKLQSDDSFDARCLTTCFNLLRADPSLVTVTL